MRDFTFLLIILAVASLLTYPLFLIAKFLKIDVGLEKPKFDLITAALMISSLALTFASIATSWYYSTHQGVSERELELSEFSRLPASAVFFLVVIFTPIFEELAFRGILQGFLLKLKVNTFVVFSIVNLLWAALHSGYWVSTLIEIFVAGLMLSAIRFRTGSLMPCIFLHIAHNALAWNFN